MKHDQRTLDVTTLRNVRTSPLGDDLHVSWARACAEMSAAHHGDRRSWWLCDNDLFGATVLMYRPNERPEFPEHWFSRKTGNALSPDYRTRGGVALRDALTSVSHDLAAGMYNVHYDLIVVQAYDRWPDTRDVLLHEAGHVLASAISAQPYEFGHADELEARLLAPRLLISVEMWACDDLTMVPLL